MEWTDIEDIADALEEAHPTAELMRLNFVQLHQWICALPGFSGDPNRAGERLLEAIQAAWITLRNEG